jgi:multidrug efflux pump subunit AcrB
MILFFGYTSYRSMPKEMYPEANIPFIFINTPYFGNSAADIENLITRPIEKELTSLKGIDEVISNSMQDFSVITAKFRSDVKTEDALRRVKDGVDRAKQELPNDLDQDPSVEEINFSEFPIMTVNISGDFQMDELRAYAEYLEEKLEDIREVTKVEMKGAQEREVKIDVDLPKMESLQVNFSDIENAVKTENITMSGGEIKSNGFRRAIRVFGEFENMEQLENMIVKSENQRSIYLKDIAKVTYDFKDRTSYARSDGNPVISLDVIKRSGMNVLDAADQVNSIVAAEKETLPKGLKISIFNDQSYYTRMEVNNLENSIISGMILVVLVLLFFLGLRNALFVGLAIPISMLTGILWLNVSGVPLNIMVLFALILALGLLVDNAIVVVENIYRYMSLGYSGRDSGKLGTGEVALPIIASTATTLAAFVPLLFWPGVMGEFMKYFPITLIIVLTSSLFVALVINPVFTSRLMKIDQKADNKSDRIRKRNNLLIGTLILIGLAVLAHFSDTLWLRNIIGVAVLVSLVNYFILRPGSFIFQQKGIPILEKAYNHFIKGALRFPGLVFVGTIGLLFGSIVLLGIFAPRFEFFPDTEPLYINAFVELPMGTDIEVTNEAVKELEAKLEETLQPYETIVESVLTQIGENTADPAGFPDPGFTPNKARISIAFVPMRERGGLSTVDAMEDIRKSLKGYPGVEITVDKNQDGPSSGKPVNLEIIGENVDELVVLAEEVKTFINKQSIAGIEELKADVRLGKPELSVHIDREAARRFGVSTFAIADGIRTAVYGKEVSKFKDGEEDYPIFIRLDEKYRNNIDDILNQKITFRSPANGRISQVPISAVADIEFNSTYNSIKRKDEQRMVALASNVTEEGNANEIVAELSDLLQDYPFPEHISWEFTGEQAQQADDVGFLSVAFYIAIFGIFIIIVAQFNSIYSPFIIILSILFSTIGVFLGYIFTGMTFNIIFSGVGIISLAGIVVNNAIVLIDYINLVVQRKRESLGIADMLDLDKSVVKDCIIQGGATRLRPVLLTAITTILSLIPLAVGININFTTLITELDPQYFVGGDNTALWGPMAWTVIFGLVFSTFLTLIVIPVMYWLAYRLKYGINKLFFKRGKSDNAELEVEVA